MRFIIVHKKESFTRDEALRILMAHVGIRGIVDVRYDVPEDDIVRGYPQRVCQLLYWNGIGNVVVLGEGLSWRKAFEDAGVFFENGKTYKI